VVTEDELGQTGRRWIVVVQIVFLLALGAFLGYPIYTSIGSDDPAARATSGARGDGSRGGGAPGTGDMAAAAPEGAVSEAVPSPAEEPLDAPHPDEVAFSSAYPQQCLSAVARPKPGLVAAVRGGYVGLAPPGGARSARFRAQGPIQFSPSGNFLLTGRGEIIKVDGGRRFNVVEGRSPSWAWSPVADCALALDGSGSLLLGRPAVDAPRSLIPSEVGAVHDMVFSRDGQRVAFLAASGADAPPLHVWIAHLDDGRAVIARSYLSGAVSLLGWANDRRVLVTHAPAALGAGGGHRVQGLRREPLADASVVRYVATVRPHGSFTRCGGRALVEVRGGQASGGNRLAYLPRRGRKAQPLETGRSDYSSPTCSPDDRFIAAVLRNGPDDRETNRLVLLAAGGAFLKDLTAGPPGAEMPIWGPTRTGIVFLRRVKSAFRVHYLGEGSSRVLATDLRVGGQVDAYGICSCAGRVAWSAEAPSGRPPR